MNNYSIKAYAKINLSLDIREKRTDGYHNLDSLFQEISLYDTVTVTPDSTGKISVSCTQENIPCNEKNIAYKAADKFFWYTKIQNPGISIHIEKNIPSEAGMGGGSTDAAGVLKLLNKIFSAFLSDEVLMSIGAQIGADVPFFIKGGLCHVMGIGEVVKPLPDLPKYFVVAAKGSAGISTPQAYKEIDSLPSPPHHSADKLLACVSDKNINELMKNCINTFELADNPEDIEKIKNILLEHNTIRTMMTGSGAAVFGIFTDRHDAVNAENSLKKFCSFSGIYMNVTKAYQHQQ